MHFLGDMYAKLRASWCSLYDVMGILVTSKWSGQLGSERIKQVLVTVSKNKSPYKIDMKSTTRSNLQSQNLLCSDFASKHTRIV